MKIQRKISSTTIIEVEGKTVQEVFEALSRLEEIFGQHETCGLCGKTGVSYSMRQNDGNKYYQAVCVACGAEFRFGVRKDGSGLFPQLKDKDGNYKPHGGWAKWQAGQQRGNGGSSQGRYREDDPGY